MELSGCEVLFLFTHGVTPSLGSPTVLFSFPAIRGEVFGSNRVRVAVGLVLGGWSEGTFGGSWRSLRVFVLLRIVCNKPGVRLWFVSSY